MLGALHQMLHISIELKNGVGLVRGGVRQNTPRVKNQWESDLRYPCSNSSDASTSARICDQIAFFLSRRLARLPAGEVPKSFPDSESCCGTAEKRFFCSNSSDAFTSARSFTDSSWSRCVSCMFLLNSAKSVALSTECSGSRNASRRGLAITQASNSSFVAITDPVDFPAGRRIGNPSSRS